MPTWADFKLPEIVPVGGGGGVIQGSIPPIFGGGVESDGSAPWWQSIIVPIAGITGSTLSNIYAPWQTSAAQASARQPVYVPVQTQGGLPPRPEGVGFGVDSRGIRLSDGSYIGWGVVALGGGIILLVQARPFSRK
jgi:hypothetical protein